MTPVHVPSLAAAALGLPVEPGVGGIDGECLFCKSRLNGGAVAMALPKSFGDVGLLAAPLSRHACPSCAALQDRRAMSGASASGLVSAGGFGRLLSTDERLAFFMAPPLPPFAVAIVNATLQHVWWHTPATYDRDHLVVRYGHRTLFIDRCLAVSLADLLNRYERAPGNPSRAFYTFSKNLKMSHDGHMTAGFLRDSGAEAREIKALAARASLGTMWAANQLVIACRKYDAEDCAAAYSRLISKEHGQ